jgi:hypothetical protein
MNRMDEPQEFSLSESVRLFIQQAFDNKIDLSVPANRKEMIKHFKEAYPKVKPSTIDPMFSREIPKIAKSYGVNPDDVKKSPAKKYSKDNEINVNATEKKSGVKVGIQNPAIIGKDGTLPKIVGAGTQPYKYEIKSSQLSAFGNAFYGMFQVFSEDLEDLTESESKDIGDLWQPYAQTKLGNNDRGQAVLAIGGTFGIMARKAKQAKHNRKLRKEKESKEKGTNLEPSREPEKE